MAKKYYVDETTIFDEVLVNDQNDLLFVLFYIFLINDYNIRTRNLNFLLNYHTNRNIFQNQLKNSLL